MPGHSWWTQIPRSLADYTLTLIQLPVTLVTFLVLLSTLPSKVQDSNDQLAILRY